MKPNHLFLDQFGEPIWARTVKELREKVGGGRVSTMYRDKKDGSVVRCGYVIGRRWFSRFARSRCRRNGRAEGLRAPTTQARMGDHGPGRQRGLVLQANPVPMPFDIAVRTALVYEEMFSLKGGRLVSIANVDPPQT